MQALAADTQRTESLQRLLNEAASRDSMRDVVCAFAEALSVWHDVEVWGYVAGAQGGFFRDVVIVGVDPSSAPSTLDVAIPPGAAMVRLSRGEAKTLGFAAEGPDVLIRQVVADNGATWLLACAGSADAETQASIALDVELLRATLSDLARAATARASSLSRASGAFDGSGRGGRRAARLPVDQLIERLAHEAVQAGSPASLMVMSIPDGSLPPALMHAWAARVKGQLRPLDFAGVISGREIAVLLRDIPADRAQGVSNRLKRLLDSVEPTDASIEPSVGLVACAPDVPISGSLVSAARDNAAG